MEDTVMGSRYMMNGCVAYNKIKINDNNRQNKVAPGKLILQKIQVHHFPSFTSPLAKNSINYK